MIFLKDKGIFMRKLTYEEIIKRLSEKSDITNIKQFIKMFNDFPLSPSEVSKLNKKDLSMIDSWCEKILSEKVDNKLDILRYMIEYYKPKTEEEFNNYLRLLIDREKAKNDETNISIRQDEIKTEMDDILKQIAGFNLEFDKIKEKENDLPYEELSILRDKYSDLEDKDRDFKLMYDSHKEEYLEAYRCDKPINNINKAIILGRISHKYGFKVISLRTKIVSIIKLFILLEIALVIFLILSSYNNLQIMMEIACVIMTGILCDIVDRVLADSKDKYYDKDFMDSIQMEIDDRLNKLEKEINDFLKTTLDGAELLEKRKYVKSKIEKLNKQYKNLLDEYNELDDKRSEADAEYKTASVFSILSENGYK